MPVVTLNFNFSGTQANIQTKRFHSKGTATEIIEKRDAETQWEDDGFEESGSQRIKEADPDPDYNPPR